MELDIETRKNFILDIIYDEIFERDKIMETSTDEKLLDKIEQEVNHLSDVYEEMRKYYASKGV